MNYADLPIMKVTRPKILAGYENGRLSTSILEAVPGRDEEPAVVLVKPAARAWRALEAAAADDGIHLGISHAPNAYRPYEVQERIFRDRYYESIFGTVRWNGKRWRKRSGVATAARPGTSNHGWGLAVDLGVETARGVVSIGRTQVEWLNENEVAYGFSHELVPEEPWHIRYFAGDETPLAVIYHELANARKEGASMPYVCKQVDGSWTLVLPGLGRRPNLGEPDTWAKECVKAQQTGIFNPPTHILDDLFNQAFIWDTPSSGAAMDYAAIAKAVNDDQARRMKS